MATDAACSGGDGCGGGGSGAVSDERKNRPATRARESGKTARTIYIYIVIFIIYDTNKYDDDIILYIHTRVKYSQ